MRRRGRIGKRANKRSMPEVVQVVVEQHSLDTPAVRFRYAVAGDGPPVVLVPGSGGWKPTFHRVIAALSDRHRVFAVDPPGQGGTRVVDPAFGYDADSVARSLGDFVDAVGLPTAAVVGHSWGGGFALRLAQLQPERVSPLALLAPGGLDVADVWEVELGRQLDDRPADPAPGLARYDRLRRPRTQAIARRSAISGRLAQVSSPAAARLRDRAARLLSPAVLVSALGPMLDWR